MALRLAVRRSNAVCNCVVNASIREIVYIRRNASAMAVPTSSQPEQRANEIHVSAYNEKFELATR